MNEPTTWTIAIGVLALLLCLRRRRTGPGSGKRRFKTFTIFNEAP